MRVSVLLTTASLLFYGLVQSKTVRYDCQTTPQICLSTCWAMNCAKNVHPLNRGGYRNAVWFKRESQKKRIKWGYGSRPCKKGGRWAWTAPAITGGKRKASYNKNRAATSPEEYPYASRARAGSSGNTDAISVQWTDDGFGPIVVDAFETGEDEDQELPEEQFIGRDDRE